MKTIRYFIARQLGKAIELISPYTIVSMPREFQRKGKTDKFGNVLECKPQGGRA